MVFGPETDKYEFMVYGPETDKYVLIYGFWS